MKTRAAISRGYPGSVLSWQGRRDRHGDRLQTARQVQRDAWFGQDDRSAVVAPYGPDASSSMEVYVTTSAPDPTRPVSSTARSVTGEIDDAEFGRLLAHGAKIGVPLAYLIALPGPGAPMAFIIAAWPAIVAGPWVGTAALLLQRVRTLESSPRTVTPRTTTPAPILAPVSHAA